MLPVATCRWVLTDNSSLNDACNFDAYFCFFASGTGGELGDGGEAGVDSCPGDDGEGECSGAARGDAGRDA